MNTDALLSFLRARLADDATLATAANTGPWRTEDEPYEFLADSFALSGRERRATSQHIVRHQPARVLAEVDAKLRLLSIHRRYTDEPGQACLGCAGGIDWGSCPVARLLALPYADHPHYREEWRP
ncbi:DUF6221 family protein [Streptomyces sp. CAU 1734]|uniref:DUF6221 family protein n=1 Tax=Streptomyces sp. CAU 1734 TaxID=3140360 RepID=UPI0032609B55